MISDLSDHPDRNKEGLIMDCVGWLADRSEAIDFVEENKLDIHESLYDYAVIRFIPQGVYKRCSEEIWFRFNYDTKKYEKHGSKVDTPNYSKYPIG